MKYYIMTMITMLAMVLFGASLDYLLGYEILFTSMFSIWAGMLYQSNVN